MADCGDVYKRQPHGSADREDVQIAGFKKPDDAILFVAPVSYTHLDVYKRQGCDCSSETELMLCDAIGAKGEEIMFSSNDTPEEEYALAAKLGAIINLDDITHIDFVERILGKLPETMSCRYNPGGVFTLSNGIMDNPGDSKYGMTTEQIFEAYRILKSKGVKRFGIHAFLASNTVTNEYLSLIHI